MVPTKPTTDLRFMQQLQALFRQQARDIASHLSIRDLRAGKDIELIHWLQPMLQSFRPYMMQRFQTGMLESAHSLSRQIGTAVPVIRENPDHGNHAVDLRPNKSLEVSSARRPTQLQEDRRLGGEGPLERLLGVAIRRSRSHGSLRGGNSLQRLKIFQSPVSKSKLGFKFDLYNAKVEDAVDQATLRFCRETNDTATTDLNAAIAQLRVALKEGMAEGDALRAMTKRVEAIFADPFRAYRIAQTESMRMKNGGRVLADKESGIVEGHIWIASSDACKLCRELDGKRVKLGEPFKIIGSGPYSHIYYSPAHPFCQCPAPKAILTAGPKKPAVVAVPKLPTPTLLPKPVVKPLPFNYGPTLSPHTLAGKHEHDPWGKADPDRGMVFIHEYRHRPEVEAKRKDFLTAVDAQNTNLSKMRKAITVLEEKHADNNEKLFKLVEKYGKSKAKLKDKDYLVAMEKRAKLTKDLQDKESAIKLAREDQLAVVQTTFKHSDPVPVQAQWVGRPDPSLGSRVEKVMNLLSGIFGKSKHSEQAIRINVHLVPPTADQRPYQDRGEIYILPSTKEPVILHEIGHALEYLYPDYAKKVRDFWAHRCEGTLAENMLAVYGGNYRFDEIGYPDHFDKVFGRGDKAAYAGKRYSGGPNDGATEITSMGLQALLENPVEFAKNDPEYFALIVGCLQGDLR